MHTVFYHHYVYFPHPRLHCVLMLFSVPVILQVNFKPLPQPTRSTPSSSPPTWSFRDTKQSRRRRQVICNWPVRPVQGKNRKTAPLTKKMTETEDDRILSFTALRDRTLYPLHWEGKCKSFICPFSKFKSFAPAEPYYRSCACLFIDGF